MIVLQFAKVLRLAYSPAETPMLDTWASLEVDIERWNERRCRLFLPMYEEEPDLERGKPFPMCCMVNLPQGEQWSIVCT